MSSISLRQRQKLSNIVQIIANNPGIGAKAIFAQLEPDCPPNADKIGNLKKSLQTLCFDYRIVQTNIDSYEVYNRANIKPDPN